MSERDGYETGVPCWVVAVLPNPEKAVGFYTALFGWEARETMGPDSPGKYFICTLRDRDVTAVGSERGGDAPSVPAQGTYIWVESADDTVAKVTEAGGGVVREPFDLLDADRIAVVADPAGAVFGVWQPGKHRGAQLVNEPGAWSMSQLNTRDPDCSKAFYGAVFGWETDTFDMGKDEITLWRFPGYVGGEPEQPVSREVVAVMAPITGDRFRDVPSNWSVDFWVHDADVIADRAAKLGGEIVAPPFDTSVGRTAVLADPQGAVFSVSKVGPAAQRESPSHALDVFSTFSPDGKKITFESDQAFGNLDVRTMNADGTYQHNVIFNSATEIEPDWSTSWKIFPPIQSQDAP